MKKIEKENINMNDLVRNEIFDLINRTKSIVISAINESGMPIIKGVTKLGYDDLKALYFVTSQESPFYKYYMKTPKTSVYLFDDDPNKTYPSHDEKYYALSLVGNMEIVTDRDIKKRFFSDYLSGFYSDGIDDKNYNLMCFLIENGKYYRGITDDFLTLDF